MLVAPQVPSGPVNDRCIALRATCPSAATMVKGIQREAMDMRGLGYRRDAAGTVTGAAHMVNRNGA
jgi:hypothetical protein